MPSKWQQSKNSNLPLPYSILLSSPLMLSSGFLPAGTLLESLIHISNEVTSMERIPLVQMRNISTMMRRIRLLSSLFDEIQEKDKPLPPSSILCFTELFSVIRRVKSLIESSREGSLLWNLMQTEHISDQFYTIVKEMTRALDILPLSLLNLTADTKELVELLHKQAKRVQLFVDHREIQRRDELIQLMAINKEKNRKNKGYIDMRRIRDILGSIGLKSQFEFEEEISKLEAEAEKQAGTGGLIVVSNVNNLISLISLSKTTIFNGDEHLKPHEDMKKRKLPMNSHHEQSFSHSMVYNIPDEFRCPISLDLMKDPVIVASGHTYDRNSIAQWINSGHHTCPKSGQRLIHMALIPNYAVRSLIHQWIQENNIPTMESMSSSELERTNSKRRSCETAIDHISETKAAVDAIKMTAEFLVGKLATGSPDIQRQAAYEIRLLAKTGMDNRRIIAEAGAIPFLVTLLGSSDSRIQENAVTAILNPRAIPALVGLLGEGTSAGKRDAATALFNLAVFNVNRTKVILARAVPLLIDLLTDEKAGITDDALAVLALLLGCTEGLEEIRKSRNLVPLLIDLLRFGSSKGKENSITLLLGLCKDGGEEVARRLLMNPRSIPSLQRLTTDGSLKARRKADALLRILNRCCSQITNPLCPFVWLNLDHTMIKYHPLQSCSQH